MKTVLSMTLALALAGGAARVIDGRAGAAGAQPSASTGRSELPATIAPALRGEIEKATTSAALEQLLAGHPDLGEFLVPRIEAAATAELRQSGPGERFVITEIQPDDGPPNSVTIVAASPGGITLTREFPGDALSAAFSDGSVQRFAGTIPFANLLTIVGEGDKYHRLTFAVVADAGLVYLRGNGRVLLETGGPSKVIQLGAER
jgi:hypothetical protein